MHNGDYILVKAPDEYPGKKYRGRYVYEHHLVWWQNTAQTIPDGFLVHHRNENKHDNAFSNLELKEWALHASEHHALRGQDVALFCAYCSGLFFMAGRNYKFYIKNGKSGFCCSHSCQMKRYWQLKRSA